jgi:hypothetical protein
MSNHELIVLFAAHNGSLNLFNQYKYNSCQSYKA